MASWPTLGIPSRQRAESHSNRHSSPIRESDLVSLKCLLFRLDQEASLDLSKQPFLRKKLRHNFDHAQLLLLQIERGSAGAKINQPWLEEARKTIKELGFRLLELEQAALNSSSDENEHTKFDENDPTATISFADPPSSHPSRPAQDQIPTPTAPSQAPRPPSISVNTLRARKGGVSPTSPNPTPSVLPASRSTGTDTQSAPINLFSEKAKQDDLSAQILKAAQDLRQSQKAMAERIKEDDENMARALDTMNNTTTKMEAASQKMGMVARMAEGRGWMGRMWLYAYIAALWVLALLVVFVMPKLRF